MNEEEIQKIVRALVRDGERELAEKIWRDGIDDIKKTKKYAAAFRKLANILRTTDGSVLLSTGWDDNHMEVSCRLVNIVPRDENTALVFCEKKICVHARYAMTIPTGKDKPLSFIIPTDKERTDLIMDSLVLNLDKPTDKWKG